MLVIQERRNNENPCNHNSHEKHYMRIIEKSLTVIYIYFLPTQTLQPHIRLNCKRTPGELGIYIFLSPSLYES